MIIATREQTRYQNQLLIEDITTMRRDGSPYKNIANVLNISIAKAQALFASYDLVSLMTPKKNYFSTKQEIEQIVEDCLDCLAFGETRYAKESGYYRDYNNLRACLQGEEKGLGKTLTNEDIDYIILKVKTLWPLQKQKRLAAYEKVFELRGFYETT